MANKCPKCQSDNPDDTKFCGNCAAPLHPSEEIPPSHTKTLETPKEELTRGTTFANRYELIEELGKGGMGKVYKVFDTKIKEEVALKLLKPEISGDEKTIERFTNELKFSRKIVHKNVCRMYDLNEEEGTHYITMEYVPGEDLKSFIRRAAPLSIGKSTSIARQICEGLSEAHGSGVVHRDLKPGNIMIDKEGNARIMDFGIARSLKAEGITGEGVIIGTPEYMSPEQVEGKEADHRSDIYSLGVILYEMMTGKVPFEGDTSLSIALKHKNEIPKDPREVNAQIPENISRLILRCMEKKKEDRYKSANELLDELKQVKVEKTRVKKEGRKFKLISIKKRKKEKRPQRLTKKILKYSLRVFVVLLATYAIISIVSLINDSVYGRKLEKVKMEHDIYYKNYFPVQKDWLPEEWRTRSGNACDVYLKLFPPVQDKESLRTPNEEYFKDEYTKQIKENPPEGEYSKVFYDFEYSNSQELRTFVENYGKYYKFDELFNAVKCSKLDPSRLIENGQYLYQGFIFRYVNMIIASAKVDFLEENYEKGLMKIYNATLFALDLTVISHSYLDYLWARGCFQRLYWELVPLFLSRELDNDQKIVKDLEKLISLILKRYEPGLAFYRQYLWIASQGKEFCVNQTKYSKLIKGFNYYLFGKLGFWKNGFSFNRDIYRSVEFYLGLFEGLKFIRNIRDKSIFIRDYCNKNISLYKGIFSDYYSIYSLAFRLYQTNLSYNITRTFGKLILIISYIDRYGMNSPEFSDFKTTNIFINELSGKPFEIIKEGEETFIVISEDYKLNLKKIDYKKHHKDILKSFKHFDFKSYDQIRSLFYSYELE